MKLEQTSLCGVCVVAIAALSVFGCSDDGGVNADGTGSESGSETVGDTQNETDTPTETGGGTNSGDGDGDPAGDGDGDTAGDGDGDGDTAGDGDGDTAGDGDGDTAGDGDGDMTGDGDGDMTGDGDGDMTGDGDGDMTGDGDGDNCETIIYPTYRDFMPLHPDFGCHMFGNGARPGLVESSIGMDNKPVHNANPPPPPGPWNGSNPQITNADTFDDWYNTKDQVNIEIQGEIELVETAPDSGVYSFSDASFYPLTGMGFGNNVDPNWAGETYPNWNGAFTTEIHLEFQFQAGQSFTYIGDDDVWVYINGELVLDIGGLHGPVEDSVDLDGLGLQEGLFYNLDVFHAERCGSGSNFRIDTSISCILPQ